MNKSEIIQRMAHKLDQLSCKDLDFAIHSILESMSDTLAAGGRIEIRGFGSFSNHYRNPRSVSNPQTGVVSTHKQGKYVPYFKPGKELRLRVNNKLQSD